MAYSERELLARFPEKVIANMKVECMNLKIKIKLMQKMREKLENYVKLLYNYDSA